MDAAIGASMAQIVIAGGSYISFAGLAVMVYYEAKTGKLYSLNGVFNKPLNFDSQTCPANSQQESCLGSKVLVPGFMKSIEEARSRFGTLSLSTLLEPSIYFAENGFTMDY